MSSNLTAPTILLRFLDGLRFLVGRANTKALDRPFIVRASQASAVATEAAKVNSSDEHKFEIMSVKSFEALGGGNYRAKIRRNAFGTKTGGDGSHVWTTNDRAFFIFRHNLFPLTHESFEALETAAASATFRLVPASAWVSADISDVYNASTNPNGLTTGFSYTFTDPYAPVATWKVLQKAHTDISDFTVTFLDTDEFEFTVQFDDANGDLASARVVARMGSSEILLWSQILSGFTAVGSFSFKIATEGDWEIIAVVSDRTGRVVEYPLTAVGGGSEVFLKIRISSSTTVATPVATITSVSGHPDWHNFVLSCSTSGATIKYQVVDLYDPPGSYSTYSSSFVVKRFHTVYAYTSKTGMTDSAVVSWNLP